MPEIVFTPEESNEIDRLVEKHGPRTNPRVGASLDHVNQEIAERVENGYLQALRETAGMALYFRQFLTRFSANETQQDAWRCLHDALAWSDTVLVDDGVQQLMETIWGNHDGSIVEEFWGLTSALLTDAFPLPERETVDA